MKIITRTLLLLPILEIVGFILAGALFGVAYTLFALIGTTLLGLYILRYCSSLSVASLQEQLRQGLLAQEELRRQGMLVLAGILLLIPGFFTDILGLLCLIPALRGQLYHLIVAKYARHSVYNDASSARIIEGEARHIDEQK